MTKLIIRIKFYAMLPNLLEQLTILNDYTLNSIRKQTIKDYICFIEYSEKISKELLAWIEQHPVKEPNIIFTTNMAHATQDYIKTLDLSKYQEFHFIHLNQNELYPSTLLQQIKEQKATQPVLLIYQNYLYNLSNKGLFYAKNPTANSFVYHCPMLEYKRYFFFYDNSCLHYLYENYRKMPSKKLEIDVISLHKSISNALVTSKLSSTEKTSLLKAFPIQLP